jgi:hypothetical protein
MTKAPSTEKTGAKREHDEGGADIGKKRGTTSGAENYGSTEEQGVDQKAALTPSGDDG